jgi:radical SAM protein with 4Fe4S-binding SPASM domain
MKKIYIKTTEACQLRCKHCYVGDNRKYTELFDEDKTIDWLKEYLSKFNIDEQDVLFSFHGGEPFLCSLDKMQKVVDNFPNALFDATSNLCFELTNERLEFIKKNFYDPSVLHKPFIKTSWDYDIRFPNAEALKLWESNVKTLLANGVEVKVIICLTAPLIENITPEDLSSYLSSLGIDSIDFERLTENTTSNKSLIPAYDKQDKWLLEFYDYNKTIRVGMFENLTLACTGQFEGCRKRQCMQEVITINANGTIGGCPNSAIEHYFADIDSVPKTLCDNCTRSKLIKNEQTRSIDCYSCDLYTICNGDCHQLTWQDDSCPAPKNLIRRIKNDVERQEKNGLPHV